MCALLSDPTPSPLLSQMPFTSLHSIELQLILRFCDPPSILALARCCQATLGAAANAFAWDAATPIRVSFLRDGLGQEANQRLLRHVPIALFWPAGVDKSAANVDRFLAVAECLPNLSSIEVQARALLSDTLSALFELPSCRRLRFLSIDAHYFKPKHLRQLAVQCPQLHTLHLSQLRSPPQRFVDLIPTLTALRSLHLVHTHTREAKPCNHGRALSTGHLCLVSDAATLTHFTRSPAFAARVSVLDMFYLQPISEFGPVLSVFPALQTLCEQPRTRLLGCDCSSAALFLIDSYDGILSMGKRAHAVQTALDSVRLRHTGDFSTKRSHRARTTAVPAGPLASCAHR